MTPATDNLLSLLRGCRGGILPAEFTDAVLARYMPIRNLAFYPLARSYIEGS